MEAARIAALRGHDVTLWEKGERLGGKLWIAGAGTDRSDLINLLKYQINSLSNLKIKIEYKKMTDINAIKAFAPEALILETGAIPIIPPMQGIYSKHVIEAGEVLSGKKELGRKVIVIGGGAVGCDVAVYIANQGTINGDIVKFLLMNDAESVEKIKMLANIGTKEVVLLEMDKTLGRGLGRSTRWIILKDLKRLGVKTMTSTVAQRIEADSVVVKNANGKIEYILADSVVVAVGSKPNNRLYEKLKDEFPEIIVVGDAVKERTALEAVREGFDAGYSI